MAAPDDEDDLPEPPRLRALRRLVTGLTVTLIFGVAVIAAALVVRIARPDGAPAAPDAAFDAAAVAAERIALPRGEAIVAVGAAGGALMLATRDEDGVERLRLYDAANGAALRSIEIARAAD